MAATIAKAIGYDNSRTKAVHRLGHSSSEAQANTWRTFSTAFVAKDGSGYVEVTRDGELIHRFEFPNELPRGQIRYDGKVWYPAVTNQNDMIDGKDYIRRGEIFYAEVED